MPHLTLEDLARLVDEPPVPDEAAHVRDCLVCRRELDEMRAQTALLGALDDPEPAPEAWRELERTLRAQGLMRDSARPWWAWQEHRPLLRAAAVAAIFLLGGASGALLWSHRPATRVAAGPETVQGAPVIATRPSTVSPGELASVPPMGPDAGPAMSPEAAPPSGARLVSSGDPGRAAEGREVRRAARELAAAEGAYVAALQRYAAIADPASGADPGTRMAALDRMISTTRTALERAPDDPVINGYHLAAVRERDDLRRQLASADKDWF